LDVPSSVREVEGCESRASRRVLAGPEACVEDWALEDCVWVWVRGCVEEGSAGGVRGAAGDAIVREDRVVKFKKRS
jgi:hypothetical protein